MQVIPLYVSIEIVHALGHRGLAMHLTIKVHNSTLYFFLLKIIKEKYKEKEMHARALETTRTPLVLILTKTQHIPSIFLNKIR